jgi:cobalt-zinc-cadmium efflux system protein
MTGRKLEIAFALTALILAVEFGAGWLSNSLALLSDAGHVLTDLVALGLAWYATRQAQRPADAQRTYGYHRIGILAALVNAITLILIVFAIGYEAISRLQHPEPVTPTLMFGAALVGIVVNLYIGFGLRAESSDNLNVRAAMLHVFGDVEAAVGVIIGGLLILFAGWQFADPLISIGITVLIAKGAWDILRETVDVLMEATPRGAQVEALVRDLLRAPGVADVHDLHVWSLAGGRPILSAHIQLADDRPLEACNLLRGELNEALAQRYAISHSTLQIEHTCEVSDLYCRLDGTEDHAYRHSDRESRST